MFVCARGENERESADSALSKLQKEEECTATV